MISVFPQSTLLGRLELIEVFEFYDKPVMFACRNASDSIFMAVLVDGDEASDIWLYVQVSPTRFANIRSGVIDLHIAFSQPENEVAFLVKLPYDSSLAQVRSIASSEILADWLPESGEFLRYETPTLPALKTSVDILARQTNRVYVVLSLMFLNQLRTEAPIKELGEVLSALQETVYAFGDALLKQVANPKTSQKGIHPSLELSATQMGAGSFEVELASSNYVDLFQDSPINEALAQLTEIVNIGSDAEELKNALGKLRIQVTTKYALLLRAISKPSISDTYLTWASPKAGFRGTARLSSLVAAEALEIIKQIEDESSTILNVTGYLIGANLRTKTFEIQADQDKYAGNIDEPAFETIRGAILGRMCQATIRAVTKTKAVTGETTTKYFLQEISQPHKP